MPAAIAWNRARFDDRDDAVLLEVDAAVVVGGQLAAPAQRRREVGGGARQPGDEVGVAAAPAARSRPAAARCRARRRPGGSRTTRPRAPGASGRAAPGSRASTRAHSLLLIRHWRLRAITSELSAPKPQRSRSLLISAATVAKKRVDLLAAGVVVGEARCPGRRPASARAGRRCPAPSRPTSRAARRAAGRPAPAAARWRCRRPAPARGRRRPTRRRRVSAHTIVWGRWPAASTTWSAVSALLMARRTANGVRPSRYIRSVAVTMPSGVPRESTTGRWWMPRSSMSIMASMASRSGGTVIARSTISSRHRRVVRQALGDQLAAQVGVGQHAPAAVELDQDAGDVLLGHPPGRLAHGVGGRADRRGPVHQVAQVRGADVALRMRHLAGADHPRAQRRGHELAGQVRHRLLGRDQDQLAALAGAHGEGRRLSGQHRRMAEHLADVQHVDHLVVVHQLDRAAADDVDAARDGAVLDQDGRPRLAPTPRRRPRPAAPAPRGRRARTARSGRGTRRRRSSRHLQRKPGILPHHAAAHPIRPGSRRPAARAADQLDRPVARRRADRLQRAHGGRRQGPLEPVARAVRAAAGRGGSRTGRGATPRRASRPTAARWHSSPIARSPACHSCWCCRSTAVTRSR